MVRLHTVAEMGVIGKPPVEQARRILADSRAALDFDYAELGERSLHGDYVRICAAGDGSESAAGGIGRAGIEREKPHMVFDAQDDPIAQEDPVRALGLRSVLLWPFQADGRRCVLALAWKHPRTEFISEDEIRYIEFLAAVISRLLDGLEQQREIAQRAHTDLLTGVPNRAWMLEHLDSAVSAARRDASRLALLYVDLNDFKKVNDQYGHAAGDVALRAVAQRIKSVLRKHETCARYGGDEFCIIITDFKDDADLSIVARRVLHSMEDPIVHGGLTLEPAASIGIAVYPRDGESSAELLAAADRAMYRAKRERTRAYAFHAAVDVTTIERPLSVDAATFRSQFMLCYQPIVSARSGRPIGAEVLPRWLHPDGMRSPEVFLRAAREQGTLGELDTIIARAVMEKAVELRQLADITYHVNLSGPNVALLDAVPNRVAPLAIEVSESQVAADSSRFIAFADMCRARGFRFGVSDFASDHLSLRVLAELRPDFVKIRLASEETERRPLKTLIDSAHYMSSEVIGESVETASEYQWLIANGVDALQGFEISSPLTEGDFAIWLRRYRTTAVR